jgi:sterol desaturase/sphingolipid hydroxylase (fatty acid hydroxylase superfamily)
MREFLAKCIDFFWTSQAGHITSWLLNYQLYTLVAVLLLASLARPAYRWTRRMWVSLGHDYFHGVLLTLLFYPLVGGCTATLQLAVDRWAPWMNLGLYRHMPGAAQVAIALILGDFLQYMAHYLVHRCSFLWHFHALHHSQQQLNPFTAKRVHAVEVFFGRCVTVSLPLVIMGSPPKYWPAYYLANIAWDYLIHSNLRIDYGPLKYVVVSPLYHRLHHSSLPRHFDKNLANRLVIWDLLFGTACFDFADHPTGVNCPDYTHEKTLWPRAAAATYARQLIYPFRMIWRDLGARRNQPVADSGDSQPPSREVSTSERDAAIRRAA